MFNIKSESLPTLLIRKHGNLSVLPFRPLTASFFSFFFLKVGCVQSSRAGGPVQTPGQDPQVIPPSVVDTTSKNVVSQAADGKPSLHISTSGKPVSRFYV